MERLRYDILVDDIAYVLSSLKPKYHLYEKRTITSLRMYQKNQALPPKLAQESHSGAVLPTICVVSTEQTLRICSRSCLRLLPLHVHLLS